MVGVLAFIVIVVLTIVGARVQIAYAQANYPSSWGWRWARFAPPFLVFTLVGYVIASAANDSLLFQVLFSLGTGLAAGLAYTFVYPLGTQTVIPRRKPENRL